jgi:hypothetical protein
MTKKHFATIAKIFAGQYAIIWAENASPEAKLLALGVLHDAADQLADFFKTTNPSFDGVRFLKACGFELRGRAFADLVARAAPGETMADTLVRVGATIQ